MGVERWMFDVAQAVLWGIVFAATVRRSPSLPWFYVLLACSGGVLALDVMGVVVELWPAAIPIAWADARPLLEQLTEFSFMCLALRALDIRFRIRFRKKDFVL